jgi:hypothetical protein
MGMGTSWGMADHPPVSSRCFASHDSQRCRLYHPGVNGDLVSAIGCCPIFLFLQSMEARQGCLEQSGIHHVAEHRVGVRSGSRSRDCLVLCDAFVDSFKGLNGVTSRLLQPPLTHHLAVPFLCMDTQRSRWRHPGVIALIAVVVLINLVADWLWFKPTSIAVFTVAEAVAISAIIWATARAAGGHLANNWRNIPIFTRRPRTGVLTVSA